MRTLSVLLLSLVTCLQASARADVDLEFIDVNTSALNGASTDRNARRDYYPPTQEEKNRSIQVMKRWVDRAFQRTSAASPAPFSLLYDGVSSETFLAGWDYSVQSTGEYSYQVAYTDPRTKLRIACDITTYPDAAAVDWVLHLTNGGDKDTPIIQELLPLNSAGLFGSKLTKDSATLRWSNGDTCAADAFLPHDEQLKQDQRRSFRGHSSKHRVPAEQMKDFAFPFFNVQVPGGGVALAVGWTGKWKADFQQNADGTLTVRAGMQNAHFYLKPGETVRTPRMVLLRWDGNEMVHGHNLFRRMMLQHYTQWRDGKPAAPPVAANNTAGCWIRGGKPLNEKSELALIDLIAPIGCEAYWLDAYWYEESLPRGGWLKAIGNWYPSAGDFPNGIKPLADAAHDKGMKSVLWFIPYVASKNTKMATDFAQHFYSKSAEGGLWNLANPASRNVLVDWMVARKKEWGFDIWRDDGGNSMPAEEDPNRLGMAEMTYYDGLYKAWDGMLEKMPDLLIDNTSGGGNRIDLETSRRSFCQWRSDFNDIGEGLKGKAHWPYMGLADQVMTAGLFNYLPFHSGPVWDMRPYSFRSAMTSGIVLYTNLEDPNFPLALARDAIAELKELRPYFLGDVYPLTGLDLSQASWYAYQLDRPDLNEGCAFFFRRPESPYSRLTTTLYNIVPEARYLVSITGETYEKGPWIERRGADLMNLEVAIAGKAGSTLLRYKRADAGPPPNGKAD